MGLDIYFYKVKETNENKDIFAKKGWSDVAYDDANKQAKEVFSDTYQTALKALKKADGTENYDKVYLTQIKKLSKLCTYPQFNLNTLGVDYDYRTHKYSYTTVDCKTFEEKEEEILQHYYVPNVAYFRKVNFIYKYFQHKLDDECAWVTKEDVDDLIANCNQITADHSLADELLPTTSGFFFGSTEYDKWYFSDIKDCKKQMQSVLKILEDGYKVFVRMSW